MKQNKHTGCDNMLKSLNEWLASEGVCEGGILELLGGFYFRIENIQTVLNECNTQDEVEAVNGLINYGGGCSRSNRT